MNLLEKFSLPSRQRGAVSIAIAMLIMLILAAAVASILNISGSSVINASINEEQVSALFLAESGLERAQATIRSAALANTYTNTTCTSLSSQSATIGRGSFTYLNAVSTPATCTGGTCTQCLITVKGSINNTSSRTIQQQMISSQQNGTTGQTNTGCPTANCTPNIDMTMTVPSANSFAFVHLIFNSTTNWGGSEVTPTCTNTINGTSSSNCTLAWNISGSYYNNPTSIGAFAPLATAGSYSIREVANSTLASGADSRNNYAAVGAVFNSTSALPFVGSYAKAPSSIGTFPYKFADCPITATLPRTEPLPTQPNVTGSPITPTDCTNFDYQHAYLDSRWTCNLNSGVTPNWVNAGTANTLLGGIGGKPYTGHTQILNGLAVNGQPMFLQLSLNGQQGDLMYSQLW